MNGLTLLLVCGSVWACFQLLAVLIGWRFTSIRPAVDWQVSFDDHADEALSILLTHEACPAWPGTPERWIALEEEFADLDGLAAELGERAQ